VLDNSAKIWLTTQLAAATVHPQGSKPHVCTNRIVPLQGENNEMILKEIMIKRQELGSQS
jgi:hypothetical protein